MKTFNHAFLNLGTALLLLISFGGYGQTRNDNISFNLVPLLDSLYIDQTEVTNSHYMEFVESVQRDSVKNYYLKILPDTSAWRSLASYVKNLAFAFYPIVGNLRNDWECCRDAQ